MSNSTFSTTTAIGPDSREADGKQVFAELYDEFGVPFVLVEPPRLGGQLPLDLPFEAAELVVLAYETGEAQVGEIEPGLWLLAIPLRGHPTCDGVAVARLRTTGPRTVSTVTQLLARDSVVGAAVLKKWADAVTQRIRIQSLRPAQPRDIALVKTMPALITLLQGVSNPNRLPSAHALASLLSGVCDTLGLDSLAWIPASPSRRPILAGAVALEPSEYRRLIAQTVSGRGSGTAGCWFTECDEARRAFGRAVPCIIVASAPARPSGWLVALSRSLSDSAAQWTAEVLRPLAAALGSNLQFATLSAQFKELLLGLMRALSAAIDAKDEYTRGHSQRVAKLAVILAQELDLDETHRSNIYLAGLLHDIGKIGIDDQVLKKPGPLTPEERQHIMSHVEIGVAILEQVRWFKHLLPGVRHHHERYDGKGYPYGVAGEQISLDGRILAVADSFDAMYSDRAYRRRRSPDEIRAIFHEGAGTQWDPKVIEAAFRVWPKLIEVQDSKESNSLQRVVEEAVRAGYNRFGRGSAVSPDVAATAVRAVPSNDKTDR